MIKTETNQQSGWVMEGRRELIAFAGGAVEGDFAEFQFLAIRDFVDDFKFASFPDVVFVVGIPEGEGGVTRDADALPAGNFFGVADLGDEVGEFSAAVDEVKLHFTGGVLFSPGDQSIVKAFRVESGQERDEQGEEERESE